MKIVVYEGWEVLFQTFRTDTVKAGLGSLEVNIREKLAQVEADVAAFDF